MATASDTATSGRLSASITIRQPRSEDGPRVWRLIAETDSLDDNSIYCNLLQCTHFAGTCALAEIDGEIVGWVSAYIPPEQPDTCFVWQVCVASAARGQGLARRLVEAVLARPACKNVTALQSTITDANAASWALFGSVAKGLGADLERAPHFTREDHLAGRQDTEFLVTIGPFARAALVARTAA